MASPPVLPAAALQPAGFSPDDDLLPRSPHSFPGYGMLTEYFVLPRKFLFFELSGLSRQLRSKLGSSLHISFLFADVPGSLTNAVSRDNIRLNCSPAINLFPAPPTRYQSIIAPPNTASLPMPGPKIPSKSTP
ncbi:MAG UNVERIFIED_CONTAM: type VI secretion system baseplate subunit TssF [Planctomycetaceae bacterium]